MRKGGHIARPATHGFDTRCVRSGKAVSVKTMGDNLLLWTLVQLWDTFVSLADKYTRVNMLR